MSQPESHTTDRLSELAENIRDIREPGFANGWNAAIDAILELIGKVDRGEIEGPININSLRRPT